MKLHGIAQRHRLNRAAIVAIALTLFGCGPAAIIDVGDLDDEDTSTGMVPDVADCEPGVIWCECYHGDTDGDGRTDEGGECFGPSCVDGLCVYPPAG